MQLRRGVIFLCRNLNLNFRKDLLPEQFGDYPGVFMQGNEIILLSARKGNGKWVPMLYNYRNGFYVLEGIEADAIIPFYFGMALPDSGSPSLLYQKRRSVT